MKSPHEILLEMKARYYSYFRLLTLYRRSADCFFFI